jgi:hypothetical protein
MVRIDFRTIFGLLMCVSIDCEEEKGRLFFSKCQTGTEGVFCRPICVTVYCNPAVSGPLQTKSILTVKWASFRHFLTVKP